MLVAGRGKGPAEEVPILELPPADPSCFGVPDWLLVAPDAPGRDVVTGAVERAPFAEVASGIPEVGHVHFERFERIHDPPLEAGSERREHLGALAGWLAQKSVFESHG